MHGVQSFYKLLAMTFVNENLVVPKKVILQEIIYQYMSWLKHSMN